MYHLYSNMYNEYYLLYYTLYSNRLYLELDKNAVVGEDVFKYLDVADTLYELDVHKHRNNDCYYHIGCAHEVGTIINKKVN